MGLMLNRYPFTCAVLLLLLFAVPRAEAAVVPVTPANVQANIDGLPAGTPESSKPMSLQAIIADSATYVGDEDAIEFAPGTYDDIGELLVTRPLTLRKDPAADGDAVITGELMIQIRSKEVKVEGLTFRDLELGEVTLLRSGEQAQKGGYPYTGPVNVYFGDVTIQSFLLDRKAKVAAWKATGGTGDCPDDIPDCGHDYSSYTGQLHKKELSKHLKSGNNADLRFPEFFPETLISKKENGYPVNRAGAATNWDAVADKWKLWDSNQPWARDSMGHILINPRFYSSENDDPCPSSDALTGIEITRNSFDGTEVKAIHTPSFRSDFFKRQLNASTPVTDCVVDIAVVGNTFRDIGVADYAYLVARDANGLPRADSDGNPVFLLDEEGNRMNRNNEDEYAIGLHAAAHRKVVISDNTIEGTTHEPLQVRNFAEGAEVTVSNNLIRAFTSGGNKFVGSLLNVDGGKEDTKVTISGNRLFRSDDNPVYDFTYYDAFRGRQKWCKSANGDPAGLTDATTIATLDRITEPTIVQSYVPNFPYPPLDGEDPPNVVDADDEDVATPPREDHELSTPIRVKDLVMDSCTVGACEEKTGVTIGDKDIVRYKSCKRRIMLIVIGHEDMEVSVVDNDIGYGGAGLFDRAIEMWGPKEFKRFSGNNIDNYQTSLIGPPSFDGSLATAGNYIGPVPRISRLVTLSRDGELSEPIVRGEGDVGPRTGMTVDSPPELPQIESASVSGSRNMIVVTYDAVLDEESPPPASAFTVRYQTPDREGTYENIRASGLSISGSTVTLTLPREIPGDASGLTLIYTAPDGAAPLRSKQGGIAARTQTEPVTGAAEPKDPGTPPPGAGAGGDGGGGCSLASSGGGGAGLGTLLLLTIVGLFVFAPGKKARRAA